MTARASGLVIWAWVTSTRCCVICPDTKGRHIWPGLATYRAASGAKGWTPEEIAEQIRLTRKSASPGTVHFSAKPILRNSGGVADVIQKLYGRPARVPATPWLEGKGR